MSDLTPDTGTVVAGGESAVKNPRQRVVVRGGNGVELVIVTPRAGKCQAEKRAPMGLEGLLVGLDLNVVVVYEVIYRVLLLGAWCRRLIGLPGLKEAACVK